MTAFLAHLHKMGAEIEELHSTCWKLLTETTLRHVAMLFSKVEVDMKGSRVSSAIVCGVQEEEEGLLQVARM
jgi:hypothetical protein